MKNHVFSRFSKHLGIFPIWTWNFKRRWQSIGNIFCVSFETFAWCQVVQLYRKMAKNWQIWHDRWSSFMLNNTVADKAMWNLKTYLSRCWYSLFHKISAFSISRFFHLEIWRQSWPIIHNCRFSRKWVSNIKWFRDVGEEHMGYAWSWMDKMDEGRW